jgi:hypothetical protein
MARVKTRIKIEDLPRDKKISREEMRTVLGGFYAAPPIMGTPEMGTMTWPLPKELPVLYWEKLKGSKK